MKPLIICALISLALLSCKKEQDPAEVLYRKAEQHAKAYQFDQAIKVLQSIRINYEESTFATQAEAEITQYEELIAIAVSNQKRTLAQKFGRIHIALENYKARFLVYPITPKDLEKLPRAVVPEWTDNWGHEIFYAPTYSRPDLPRHLPDGYALASFGEDGLPGGEGSANDYFFKNGLDVTQVTE